jgi:hypothetical protein
MKASSTNLLALSANIFAVAIKRTSAHDKTEAVRAINQLLYLPIFLLWPLIEPSFMTRQRQYVPLISLVL